MPGILEIDLVAVDQRDIDLALTRKSTTSETSARSLSLGLRLGENLLINARMATF